MTVGHGAGPAVGTPQGRGDELGEALARRRLGLAGAYVELPYPDHDALEEALPQLDAVLDVFDAVRSYLPGPPPRPTLADSGSKQRAMLPARSVRDHSLGFDADGWRRFAAGLALVIARCRDRGYEPTFHPETGTHVEAPWEIERVLDVSDVGLCLETGHMLLGGGDWPPSPAPGCTTRSGSTTGGCPRSRSCAG
jgi:inosose dehydratase